MVKISIVPLIFKKLKECIGIAEDTDTASQNISSGKYVIWKGSSYKASDDISEGDTLSSENLTEVTDGLANDLSTEINNNSQAIANKQDIRVWTATLSSTTPIEVEPHGEHTNYYTFIMKSGLLQGVGVLFLFVRYSNGTLTIKSILDGTDFSNSHLTFTDVNGKVRIATDVSNTSYITIIS